MTRTCAYVVIPSDRGHQVIEIDDPADTIDIIARAASRALTA